MSLEKEKKPAQGREHEVLTERSRTARIKKSHWTIRSRRLKKEKSWKFDIVQPPITKSVPEARLGYSFLPYYNAGRRNVRQYLNREAMWNYNQLKIEQHSPLSRHSYDLLKQAV